MSHISNIVLEIKMEFWFWKRHCWYETWRAIHVGSTFQWKIPLDFENDIVDMWPDVPYTSVLLFNEKSIFILRTILLIWDLTCHTHRFYFPMKSSFWFWKRHCWYVTWRAIHFGSTFQWKVHFDFENDITDVGPDVPYT